MAGKVSYYRRLIERLVFSVQTEIYAVEMMPNKQWYILG